MARKPSHLASYCMPGGIFATGLASIGFTGGITGRSMPPILRAVRSRAPPGMRHPAVPGLRVARMGWQRWSWS